MRHLKYLAAGSFAAVIAVVILGCVIAIFAGMFWLIGNYPNVATVFTVLAFIYFLGFGIIEQREMDAIRAEREAHLKEQAEKLTAASEKLTAHGKGGTV